MRRFGLLEWSLLGCSLLISLGIASLDFASQSRGRSPSSAARFVAESSVIPTGTVMVSTGNGMVQEWTNSGAFIGSIDTRTASFATTGSTFDSTGNFYVSDFDANTISKFDPSGNLIADFGGAYNADPESIAFDSEGDAFVGQADGTHQVLEFDSSGALIGSFSPATENRGTDWITLAADQKTLFYTSEGKLIKRFDLSTVEQLPDFNAIPLPGRDAYELRILPGGDILVADSGQVVRLGAGGNQIQSYSFTGSSGRADTTMFALAMDPDGTSFWTADVDAFDVFKVDIETGTILVHFNAASVSDNVTAVGGLTVKGVQPFLTPTPTASPTPTGTASATATPTLSPAVTPTGTPTMTPTPTPAESPSSTPAQTSTATATPNQSATATATETSGPTASPTVTAGPTGSPTETPATTATPAGSPAITPSATETPIATASPLQSPTMAPTQTPSVTPTANASPTATPLETATPMATLSPTPTSVATSTATSSAVATATPIPVATPTATIPLPTPTSGATPTPPANTTTPTPPTPPFLTPTPIAGTPTPTSARDPVLVPTVVSMTGSPGQAIDAGGSTIVNQTDQLQTITAVTVMFSNPGLFSSATLTISSGQSIERVRAAPPTRITVFTFGQPFAFPAGASARLRLSVTISPNTTAALRQAAVVEATMPIAVPRGTPALPIGFAVVGLVMLPIAGPRRRRIALVAGIALLATVAAVGCDPCPSCGSKTSQQEIVAITATTSGGAPVEFSGLPAALSTITVQ